MASSLFSQTNSHYIDQLALTIDEYVGLTNRLLGVCAFTVVFAVFTTKYSQFWASLAWVSLVLSWGVAIQQLRGRLDELKYMGHEGMKPWNLLKRTIPALGGMVLLTAVAAGDVAQDKFFLPLDFLLPVL